MPEEEFQKNYLTDPSFFKEKPTKIYERV